VSVAYLIALLVSMTGMVVLDRKFGLFFWRSPRAAAVVLSVGVLFFLAWDVVGITTGIFYRGETSFMTGILVAPELPIEEVVFLTFLCYLFMNALQGARMLLARRRTS
jgi:lycopene cyclase domain-containing protein